MPHVRTSGGPARRRMALPCLAAAAGVLVYLNALHNPLVYDDFRTIADNASILSLTDFRAVVGHDVTRPLVNLSYAIDRAVWRGDTFGFHLSNVALHAVNVVLFFWVAVAVNAQGRRPQATDRRLAALAAALLFAVHPLSTEAVGYISGRADVLSAALFLAAFLAARRWMNGGGVWWWLLTLVCWAGTLLAKEIGIVLPAVLFAYDRLVLQPDAVERRRRFWRMHLPLVAAAAAVALGRVAVFALVERGGKVALDWRSLLAEAGVLWRYVGLVVVPAGQTIYHDVQAPVRLWDANTVWSIAAALALVASLGIAWRADRVDRTARFGIFWFVLLLSPPAVLVLIDRTELMAEHRAYLASAGLFLAGGSLVRGTVERLSEINPRLRGFGIVAVVAVLLSLSARTILRNAMWSDPVRLWQEALDRAPRQWRARAALGESLHAAGRHEQAVAEYRAAVALNPDAEPTYMNLGVCLSELGRTREAEEVFESLRRRNPGSSVATVGLGAVSMFAGDAARSREYLLEALEHDPRNVMALQWLAVLEESVANPREAHRWCEAIQELMPGSASTADCLRRTDVGATAIDARPR